VEVDVQEARVLAAEPKLLTDVVQAAYQMAAIPEAVQATTPRSSKRRAATTNEHSQERAERLKAMRNEGTDKTFPAVSDFNDIASNLFSVGFELGKDQPSLEKAICSLHVDSPRTVQPPSVFSVQQEVFDREEQELSQEEQVDTLLLNYLCGDLTEEVLDGEVSDHLVNLVPAGTNSKRRRGVQIKSRVSKRRVSFGTVMGLETQPNIGFYPI
jgi:hypothetical protein